MSDRTVIHVVPHGSGEWAVKRENTEKASAVCDNKDQALQIAIQQAKNAQLSQVVIHDRHGVIQSERTYGNDPYPPEG